MNTKETLDYLKRVAELETSLYKQSEVRRNARNNLVQKQIQRMEPVPPKKATVEIQKPQKPQDSDLPGVKKMTWKYMIIPGILVIAFCIVLILGGGNTVGDVFPGIILGAGLILGGVALYRWVEGKVLEKENSYQTEMNIYNRKVEDAEKKYQQAMTLYLQRKTEADEKYQADTEKAIVSYRKAKKQVELLEGPLHQTQDLLTQIYAVDVIFPKYRNMVAMCTMYEYFASGRCTELTGPNGAYNLYEAELRQNLIINQLEQVNANLEQVKQNQYILYQGITETNMALREISADVKRIVDATTDIAESSRITAFCSKITAQNTEVMKYITLLNG